MNDNPLRSIVIAGGGVAGWVAAARAAVELKGQEITIRVVEDPQARPSGQAVPAMASTLAFHDAAGVDEPSLVRTTGATFRLGTRFVGWSAPGSDEIHPIAGHGASIEYLPFHQFANRARLAGDPTPYGAYCLASAAARAGRFAPPVDDPRSILSTLAYGLNLDVDGYAAFLKDSATRLGVGTVAGPVKSVEVRSSDGFIEALGLAEGGRVEADLFIDCTGGDSRLLGDALGVAYEDWGDLLPGNRAAWAGLPADPGLPSASTVTARDDGWLHSIPLQHATREVFVFDGKATSDEQAAAVWPEAVRPSVRFSAVRPGRRREFWRGNCVALGAAAGVFQPLDGAGLATVQSGIARLMGLLPLRDCDPLLAEEYNRLTGLEYQNLRDFQALHYQLAGRDRHGFWNVPDAAGLPASLALRMRLFRAHGQVALYEEESWSEAQWAAAWLLHGAWPAGYEPIMDGYDLPRLGQRFGQMRQVIAATAGRLPTQKDFIARNGLAGPA